MRLFPEQARMDIAYWNKIAEATKGESLADPMRLELNELFLDLASARTEEDRLLCQGRAIAIRRICDMYDRAVGEMNRLQENIRSRQSGVAA